MAVGGAVRQNLHDSSPESGEERLRSFAKGGHMIDGGISVSVGTGSRSRRPALPAVFALAVVLAACAVAPASATSLVNLLVNPGAEQQPVTSNGWIQESGDWTIARGDDAGGIGTHTDANFFWGGQSASAELYQEVDLSGYRAWLGDDGLHSALFVAYLGSWSGDGDTSQVVVEARDEAGAVLGSVDSGASNPDVWTRVQMKLNLPGGTARIRVRLLAVRAAGSDNNGYFDDVGLYLPPPNLLVNPGAELQPVTNNGWTQASGDWTIPRGDDAGGIGTHSGDNFFWGGQSAAAELYQDVDLSQYRGWLGDGTQRVFFAGYYGSWSGDNDEAQFEIQLLDDLGGVVDTETTPFASPNFWARATRELLVPPEVATVRVILRSQRLTGADNNGYFDDVGLYLPALNLLVNPGAELQPVTNNGWFATFGDWTIPRGDDDGGIGTHSGSNFFWAGLTQTGLLRQVYDVSSYRGWIGNGAQTARLIAYKGSFSGDADTAQIQLEAFDDPFQNSTTLLDVESSPDVWTRSELVLPLPAYVERLRSKLHAERVDGTNNNGYFDDMHLQIEAPDWLFDANTLFRDGFEVGSAAAWSAQVP